MLKENRLNSENNETKKEKTSNHKLLKFFTLILLLFSFFTIPTITLSNVKAEESDPLQGTWVFNDTLDFSVFGFDVSEGVTLYINFEFECNGVNYSAIFLNISNHKIYYRGDSDLLVTSYSGFLNELYKTITITSLYNDITVNNDLTTKEIFLTWLQSNATKQEEEPEAPAIPEIPSGYRQINSGDLLRTFGVELATSLYIDTSATPTASATSTLTFNGNVNFTGYDASVSDYVSYTFTQFLVEVSSSGVYIYAQTNDYSVNIQWYNINTGWNDLFGGYTLTTDLNTTILLNGEMSAFYWLYVKDLSGYDNYTINLYQGEWSDTQQIVDYTGLQYSINNGMTWNEINTLPLVVANINQIMFLNNSSNTSTFYISDSALGTPLYSLSNGQTSVNLPVIQNTTFYLGYILAPSENSYFISGGYRFNTTFTVSGNYNYTLNFKYTFGTNETIWNSIVIIGNTTVGRNLDYRNGQGSWSVNVFSSDRLSYNIMRFNDRYPATERYITFFDQYVDENTYNFLKNSGEFGVFSNPSEVIDGGFDFGQGLLNGVNSFLSFEVFPNFSLLNLLQLTIAIPLLIYILKLFLGG